MALIRSLDNPELYERKEHVAVFMPHERKFPAFTAPDGTKVPERIIKVTDEDLPEIARNTNAIYQQNGQLVKLVVGHRQSHPDFPEQHQAKVVGYARNYRSELVDRPGGKALRLTHTEYIRKGTPEAQAVRNGQCPERSPEYHPDKKLITGVALLTRDPHLPLGTVSYDADSKTVLYAMGTETMNENPPMDEPDGDEPDPVAYAAFMKCMKKYSAAMGPGNSSVPGITPQPAPPAGYAANQRPVNYQNDPAYLTLKNEVDTLKAANAEAHKRASTVECARMLDPLVPLRSFDYQAELNTLVALPVEHRQSRIEYMLNNFREIPTGGMFRLADTVQYAAADGTPAAFKEPAGHQQALNYMRQSPGLTYDAALAKARGK